MAAGCSVRPASPADLEAILALEQACAEAPHWGRNVWLAALTQQSGTVPARRVLLAERQDGLSGFAVGTCSGDLAELESIAVSENARRQGIGNTLCLGVMEWSRGSGARTIELEVRASSVGALALYRSLGFVEQGRRARYYHSPTEDAVLMAAPL